MLELEFLGEGEPSANVDAVTVELIAEDGVRRTGREVEIGDDSLRMGHVPTSEMTGLITQAPSPGTW